MVTRKSAARSRISPRDKGLPDDDGKYSGFGDNLRIARVHRAAGVHHNHSVCSQDGQQRNITGRTRDSLVYLVYRRNTMDAFQFFFSCFFFLCIKQGATWWSIVTGPREAHLFISIIDKRSWHFIVDIVYEVQLYEHLIHQIQINQVFVHNSLWNYCACNFVAKIMHWKILVRRKTDRYVNIYRDTGRKFIMHI